MNNSDKSKTFFSTIGLIVAPLIWGFSFVVVKDSLDHIGPVWMVALRYTIAFAVLSLCCIKKFSRMNVSYLINGIILGVLLFTAYILQTIGCKYTTAGKNAFLTTFYVILVPLFTWLFFGKRPKWFVFLSALLCLAGIAFLSLEGTSSLLEVNKGDVLTLGCGIFFAVHIVFMSRFNKTQDPVLLTALQFGVAAVLGWIMAPFYDGAFPSSALRNFQVIRSLLYLGLGASMIGFLLQNVGLKYVHSALASLFLSLESVFGMFFSVMMLGEKMTAKTWLGCILIFISIMIAEVLPPLISRLREKK
ncbi:MAG: DMT family transporter [Treponema sp.]|nr:DMT family transporter [Treponema sp.]